MFSSLKSPNLETAPLPTIADYVIKCRAKASYTSLKSWSAEAEKGWKMLMRRVSKFTATPVLTTLIDQALKIDWPTSLDDIFRIAELRKENPTLRPVEVAGAIRRAWDRPSYADVLRLLAKFPDARPMVVRLVLTESYYTTDYFIDFVKKLHEMTDLQKDLHAWALKQPITTDFLGRLGLLSSIGVSLDSVVREAAIFASLRIPGWSQGLRLERAAALAVQRSDRKLTAEEIRMVLDDYIRGLSGSASRNLSLFATFLDSYTKLS